MHHRGKDGAKRGVIVEGKREQSKERRLAVLGPLVLAADLVFLLGGEIVLDIERLADLVGGLSLDHIRDRLATDVEESLDVEIVGRLEHS